MIPPPPSTQRTSVDHSDPWELAACCGWGGQVNQDFHLTLGTSTRLLLMMDIEQTTSASPGIMASVDLLDTSTQACGIQSSVSRWTSYQRWQSWRESDSAIQKSDMWGERPRDCRSAWRQTVISSCVVKRQFLSFFRLLDSTSGFYKGLYTCECHVRLDNVLCCAVLYTVFIYLIMIVLFWEYVQSMWIMCLLICLYYMLFHCSGSVCLYMNKFHWWDLLSYILNRIFQFLSLSLSLSLRGGGDSPPYAKNEGGGELSSLCKKMGGEMSTPYYIAGGEMP